MLSSDVLPAPLGPITEIKSPRLTSRLTRLTACTPPNAFETSWICRSVLIERSNPNASSSYSILADSPLCPSPLPFFSVPIDCTAPSAGFVGAILPGGRQAQSGPSGPRAPAGGGQSPLAGLKHSHPFRRR